MLTQDEMEAAVAGIMARFMRDQIGRDPRDARAYLRGDLLLVRLAGVLTAAEQQLAKTQPRERGRDLLKMVRTHLAEHSRAEIETLLAEVLGVKINTFHHDISTVTGEEIFAFGLAAQQPYRAQ